VGTAQSYSQAFGINDAGQVAGAADTQNGTQREATVFENNSPTHLGTLGGNTSVARDINNSGQVVGWSYTTNHAAAPAFLYQNGTMTALGSLGNSDSEAYAINDVGQVVGYSYIRDTNDEYWVRRAFLYQNGSMASLGTLGDANSNSYANDINNSGQVVGTSNITDGSERGFLYHNGVMTNLGTLGGYGSAAYGINESGQIVGYADLANDAGYHAFLYENGTMKDLGTLGGFGSGAYDINNSGQIVGWAHITNDIERAFLYENGTMINLNTLLPANSGWVLTEAFGINNNGQIHGRGIYQGVERDFVMTLTRVLPVAKTDAATFNEDSSHLINVLANDTGDTLTITGSTAGAHGSTQGTINGAISNTGPWNGLVYTPEPNYFGTDSFTYTVTDQYGGAATGTVNVTVLSVNDAPSFTKGADPMVNEDAGLQTVSGWATNLSRGPANESVQKLSFLVSATNPSLFAVRPAVSPTGTLAYKTAANKHGSATVTVTLRDSGGTLRGGVPNSAPQSFTITVNPVNDAPVANAGIDQSATQTGVQTNVRLSGSASKDLDGDTLTYQWRKGTAVIASTATTTVALAPGRHTFTLQVTDPSGASDTDSVVVNVLPPASTAGVSANGSGTIKINTVARSFSFSVSTGSGTPSGNLSYVDTQNNKNVVATQITSIVVSSNDVRIFGKAKVNGSGSFDFAVTARDNAAVTPPVADAFGIALSDGYASGSRVLASGDIVIGPAP
jgi:probable HAF family extracellular repeat protein